MSDPVHEYLDAAADFDAARKGLMSFSENVAGVGRHLRGRHGHLYIGDDGTQGMAFDSAQWPTAEQIVELITKRQDAQTRLLSIWDKIPDEKKQGLRAPRRSGMID